MITTIIDVVRGEGVPSSLRRTTERIAEATEHASLRMRGWFAKSSGASILNFSASSVAPRTGGVAIQLAARLRAERALRSVALLHPGRLELSSPLHHARRVVGIREALAITGAKAIHVEGTAGAPLVELLRLAQSGVAIVVTVHDLTAWDEPAAGPLFESAARVIFPSPFLLNRYRQRFEFEGEVIEPAVPASPVTFAAERTAVAFAGSVRRHKGGHLLPAIARAIARPLHVFGGGDVELLRPLRALPNVVVHGYYRSGTLPSLLARHRVGLVLLLSIVEESYSLTMSEAWLAGAAVAAFDLGAPAERIRSEGGGWLAPLGSGADGLAAIVDGWKSNGPVPRVTATPLAAAQAHIEFYRARGLL